MKVQLSATSLALSTANDPQFRLPHRPATVPGTVLTWVKNGLFVEGTGNRRTINGRSAQEVLPALLPLLDGTRTIEEIAAALGHPEGRLRAVLLFLYSCGILQDGPVPTGDALTPQVTLLGRLLDTTRANVHVGQAQERLTSAHVGVHAPDSFATALSAELSSMGMQPVWLGPEGRARPGAGSGPDGLDLAIVWVEDAHDMSARRVCRSLRERGVPVLLVGAAEQGFFIGPYSAPDYGACADCYQAQLPSRTAESPGADPLAVAGAQTALEVASLVSRVGTPTSLRGRTIVDIRSGGSVTRYLAPRPGCDQCGDPSTALREAPIAYAYETSVGFPPRRLVNPRDHQHHFEATNVLLQFEMKEYPDRPGVALPEGDLAPLADAAGIDDNDRGAVSLEALATILAATCGLKEPPTAGRKVARWAPTGGNLGSPTAYVLARDIPGLNAGGYAYDSVGHRLVTLRDSLPKDFEGMTEPAVIVLTGALLRVAKKYRTFAYRVIHLDAGVALTNALLVCKRLGVKLLNEPAWDDMALLAALNVDWNAEAVTAVVRLGGRNR